MQKASDTGICTEKALWRSARSNEGGHGECKRCQPKHLLSTNYGSWRYPSNETETEPLCLGRLYLRRRNGGCTMITMAKLLRLMLVLTVMMRLIKKGRQTREKGTSNGSISWWVGWTQQSRREILTGLIRCISKLVGVVEWPWKWPNILNLKLKEE